MRHCPRFDAAVKERNIPTGINSRGEHLCHRNRRPRNFRKDSGSERGGFPVLDHVALHWGTRGNCCTG